MNKAKTVRGRDARPATRQGRRPTLTDVAHEAGVSVKTASRVINHESTVQPEYVERVSRAIAKVGFRRNELARNLRTGANTATIGLVIGDVRNPFYSVITRVIEQVAWTHDTLLLTCSTEEDPEREKELVQELCQRRVDGLVVVPTYADHSFCREEIEMGTPMVFIDRRPAGAHGRYGPHRQRPRSSPGNRAPCRPGAHRNSGHRSGIYALSQWQNARAASLPRWEMPV